ncbi:RHS repeat-associated core domain-containing protein [Pseudomonas lini]|uniref:RHS repeat-associated core domain-containing protein n=1 Tax=Pseudomonas lini TaxID=163011 RepID=UPI00345E3B01
MDLTVHRKTPSIAVNDGRGLAVCQVAYLRKSVGAPLETLITRQRHDVAGRPVEHWDPRLFGSRPNLTTIHGLAGQPLKIDSVDSGWRLSLLGMAGEVISRWDERGNQWRTTYDNQLRVLAVDVNGQPNVEVWTYAKADADPGHNLRGQLIRKIDPSGSMEFDSFSLQYLPFAETRTLFDGSVHTTRWLYGADGKALSQTDAGNHQQHSRYGIAGQLKQITLQINANDSPQDILKDAQYNAAGQVIEQQLGNGVAKTWIYDKADARLTHMKAGVPGQALRQDLEYGYDQVGNVLRIKDHTFNPVFFANQYIDGTREFTYDSLYRLASATGHDTTPPSSMPGRPLPNDPNNILNYTQTYEYDTGGNLIKLTHSRAVGGYTHQMRIDPSSNRGVRWKEGDPEPVFSRLFDLHGNLQALQPGQSLHWNSRNELTSITLIERETGLDDKETYRYSNGERVYKRHETHTSSTSHFHEVRYLPGLEIRTRDTGEALHVITLPNVIGNVRCLHWLSGKPGDIEANQVRYCLDDSQGSSLIELDQTARLISHEHYYPFGGTAWLAADSEREVSYKTIRYSGKEMDDSGLYYYGRRYYAPWLQRWISADPAGAVDGLNLYAMVGNNPMSFVDILGLTGGFPEQMSSRSTSILTANTRNPLPPRKGKPDEIQRVENAHLEKFPDAKFTKRKLNDLSAHAGAEYSDGSPENSIIITDMFNIVLPAEGVEAYKGVKIHKPRNVALGESNPANLGILRIDADVFIPELNEAFRTAYNDQTYPVKIYRSGSDDPIDMRGIEYEARPLHSLTEELTKNHIIASDGFIPQGAGIPSFHAETRVLNTAALMIPNISDNLQNLTIITQRLQKEVAAVAFPACFNCSHILDTSRQGRSAIDIPTGRINLSHEEWKHIVQTYPR